MAKKTEKAEVTKAEKKVSKKVVAVKTETPRVARQVDYSFIKRPLLTEKSNRLAEHKNKVVGFIVDVRATKTELKEAFERIFGVTVLAVRTASLPGKPKRSLRGASVSPSKKKAYVTLQEGQTIDVVEGI